MASPSVILFLLFRWEIMIFLCLNMRRASGDLFGVPALPLPVLHAVLRSVVDSRDVIVSSIKLPDKLLAIGLEEVSSS